MRRFFVIINETSAMDNTEKKPLSEDTNLSLLEWTIAVGSDLTQGQIVEELTTDEKSEEDEKQDEPK